MFTRDITEAFFVNKLRYRKNNTTSHTYGYKIALGRNTFQTVYRNIQTCTYAFVRVNDNSRVIPNVHHLAPHTPLRADSGFTACA